MFARTELTGLSNAFIDDQPFGEVKTQILYHLRDCGDCMALIEKKIGLKRMVRASVRNLTAPATLKQSVRVLIGA